MKLKKPKFKTPLDRAVAEFEWMFTQVVDGPATAMAPNGMPYRTFVADLEEKREGEDFKNWWTSEDVAVAMWLQCAKSNARLMMKNPTKPTKILYWRQRPVIEYNGAFFSPDRTGKNDVAVYDKGQVQVYSRFAIDG